ncbi:uncharacterized protein LOC118179307 [Stegodyphus dumicola]|uniref:uncharacterized protein LOC118179307 n=1 Tax=Stegodyphus dumicola TaxID=202533 RepID=UPI0015AF7DF5|nr:uncharacterized protein LOC118179307 [Stegodyphus dumicola]
MFSGVVIFSTVTMLVYSFPQESMDRATKSLQKNPTNLLSQDTGQYSKQRQENINDTPMHLQFIFSKENESSKGNEDYYKYNISSLLYQQTSLNINQSSNVYNAEGSETVQNIEKKNQENNSGISNEKAFLHNEDLKKSLNKHEASTTAGILPKILLDFLQPIFAFPELNEKCNKQRVNSPQKNPYSTNPSLKTQRRHSLTAGPSLYVESRFIRDFDTPFFE